MKYSSNIVHNNLIIKFLAFHAIYISQNSQKLNSRFWIFFPFYTTLLFLVGAFRRKTQTIVVTFLFLKDQRSDRFYKLDKLTWTNTKCHTTSTGTWFRGYLGFFEVPFYIFRHYETYRTKKNLKNDFFFQFFPHAGTLEENTWYFEVLLRFLSLGYGADLGKSRLVFISSISCTTKFRLHILIDGSEFKL